MHLFSKTLSYRTLTGAGGQTPCFNTDLPKKVLSGTAISAEYSYLVDVTRTAALGGDGEGLVYRGAFTYRRSASGALVLRT